MIDGNVAYPSTSNKIKVTYFNQYISDSGTYTYDVNFPMDIHTNRMLFRNVNRFDVKKLKTSFEDCKIFADNRLIMTGKGVVTSVTDKVVKLQIIGGKSRLKYNANFEKHFIDEMDYQDIVISKGLNRKVYGDFPFINLSTSRGFIYLWTDLSDSYFVGQPDVCAFNPIYDENNKAIANNFLALRYDKKTFRGITYKNFESSVIMDFAPQPFLLYILKEVLMKEGYDVIQNDFDKDPWRSMLIANVKRARRIKDTLPHWSVYTFINEIQKFFNASILFDDVNKTVRILSVNEICRNEVKNYECIDEYSEEYEDEGLKNIITSNVEYDFANSGNRSWKEAIPMQVFKDFELEEYKDYTELLNSVEKMTDKDKRTHIFKVKNKYYIIERTYSEKNSESFSDKITQCGFFNPIIRNVNNTDSVKLKIAPVATFVRNKLQDDDALKGLAMFDVTPFTNNIYIPSAMNEQQIDYSSYTFEDQKVEDYVTVQDAIQEGASKEKEEQADEIMSVMFQRKKTYNVANGCIINHDLIGNGENIIFRFPITYTDMILSDGYTYTGKLPEYSDALRLENSTRFSSDMSLQVDAHNLFCIKFITKEIPDPSMIFIFKNKKFICQKIEIDVSDDGINKLKTGYFYEIL